MKKTICTIFKFLILTQLVSPAFAEISIIANVSPLTPKNDKIFMTGNFLECRWQPKCIEMEKVFDYSYRAILDIPNEQKNLEFKFTRGGFSSEEVSSLSRIPNNHFLELTNTKEAFVFNIPHWKDLPPLKAKGHFQFFELYSEELNKNKAITVFLPPSYYKNPKRRFPVIYMHDGQNLFDPLRATFSNEWSIDEVLSRHYKTGSLPEVIIVGIDNDPKERSLEYNYYDKGKEYGAFVAKNLKHKIDQSFRTKSNRENTFLMGSSYGALISFTIQWEYPDIFKKAAGLSFPAHAKEHYIERFVEEFPLKSKDIHFYMDRGDYNIDARYSPHTENFHEKLIDLGFPRENLQLRIIPYADHTELNWAQRVHIPLNFLLIEK